MSSDESNQALPSLPADVAMLLADARQLEAPPVEVRARLRARLASSIPPSGGSPGGASASPWSRAPWWLVAAALAVGVVGGRLSARSSSTASNATSSNETSRESRVTETPAPAVADATSIDVATLPTVPTNNPASQPVASRTSGDLGAERRILAVARTALGRNDGTDALAACDEHAHRFPRGLLAEEREAIAVQALAEGKRSSEAKQRAERFRANYPKSILLPVVTAAIEEAQ